MNENKKAFVIINPISGRGLLRSKLWQILNLFSAAQIITTVVFTQKRGDAEEFAKNCPEDVKTVVCAGGDGTLNEVICGLMKNPYPHELGYIPVGTTNDLANSLGLSKNPIKAAEDIIFGQVRTIDIGSFSGRYFNYIASFGAFTEASYNTPQSAKNLLGHFAYVLEGIKCIANIRPYHVKFELDDEVIEDDYIFAAVSNTTSVGGVLKLKETMVALNDGKFELLLIHKPKSIIQLNKIITELVSQKFTNDCVKFYHTSKVKVITDEPIDWTLDGELQKGGKEIEIINLHSAVNFIINKRNKGNENKSKDTEQNKMTTSNTKEVQEEEKCSPVI